MGASFVVSPKPTSQSLRLQATLQPLHLYSLAKCFVKKLKLSCEPIRLILRLLLLNGCVVVQMEKTSKEKGR